MAALQDLVPTTTWTCPTCGRTCPDEFAVCPLDATPRNDPSKPGDAQIGTLLGGTYRITRVLAQGGMARLYEAEHVRVDARFAVKIIHDELAREPSMLARFEREAHAAGRIRSDHVVRLVDVLRTHDDRPCLVTELLEGEDLDARLGRGKLTVAEAIPIARQLCKGIEAAHAVGVVHRDLKPSNVFLCRREGTPLVKVLDFGIAKIEDDEKLTRTGAVIGTATYMAPEQARRASDAGPLADIYSIGAILYHMLAGQPPYGSLPPVSRFALLLNEEPARPRSLEPSIPAGVEAVIQHAMARDTTARIATVTELEQQLAAFDAPERPDRRDWVSGAFPTVPIQTEVTAQTLALRARLSRPSAVFVAIASCLAASAWIATLLAVLLGSTSRGERALIALIAIGTVLGIGGLHVKRLRARWESMPAISRYIAPFARAVIGGVITFGALELIRLGWFAIAHSDPLGLVARLLVAGVAAVLGLGWQTWRLDSRLRRVIG